MDNTHNIKCGKWKVNRSLKDGSVYMAATGTENETTYVLA